MALVGLPAWLAGPLDPSIADTMFAYALVVPIILLVPWGFSLRKLIGSATPRVSQSVAG